MPNETTKAFRRMMLNSRLNQLMTDAIEEGIAATKAARSSQDNGGGAYSTSEGHPISESRRKDAEQQLRRVWGPIYFTPVSKKPRRQSTEAEPDEEFRIPDYVLKSEPKPKD